MFFEIKWEEDNNAENNIVGKNYKKSLKEYLFDVLRVLITIAIIIIISVLFVSNWIQLFCTHNLQTIPLAIKNKMCYHQKRLEITVLTFLNIPQTQY